MMQSCMCCIVLSLCNMKMFKNLRLFMTRHKKATQRNARIGSKSILACIVLQQVPTWRWWNAMRGLASYFEQGLTVIHSYNAYRSWMSWFGLEPTLSHLLCDALPIDMRVRVWFPTQVLSFFFPMRRSGYLYASNSYSITPPFVLLSCVHVLVSVVVVQCRCHRHKSCWI